MCGRLSRVTSSHNNNKRLVTSHVADDAAVKLLCEPHLFAQYLAPFQYKCFNLIFLTPKNIYPVLDSN